MKKILSMLQGWAGVIGAALPMIVGIAFDVPLAILNLLQGLGAPVDYAYKKVYETKIHVLDWIKKQAWLA